MTKAFAAVTAASFFIAAHPALAFQNEPDGFRGIDWDTPIAKVQDDLVALPGESRGNNVFYQRKGDKLSIGSADLEYVNYVFYKGQFMGVLARTAEGITHQRALRDAITAQFGQGDQPNRYIERFHWFGTVANMSLDCFGTQRRCTLFLRSRAVTERERADKKAAAQEAKKDF